MKNSTFGRSAVARGLLTREQLREAEQAQGERENQGPKRPIGELLIEFGLMQRADVEAVRIELKQQLVADSAWLPAAMRECELGRLACYRGLLTEDELKAGLWSQALAAAEGVGQSIGEQLVNAGFLTTHQLLHAMMYEVLFCERCQTLFKVNGFESGMRIKCTSCPVMLKAPPHDLKLISSSRDLFIDSHGLLQRTTYGELAVRHQFCTAEQIAKAVDRWSRGMGDRSLGEILIEMGMINAAQDSEIDAHVERRRQDELERQRTEFKGLRFGEIAVKMGLITSQMLLDALKQQSAQGMRVGERLCSARALTINQGLRVLEMQNKAILRCSGCATQFNVSLQERGLFPSCPSCKQRMDRISTAETLEIDSELAPVRADV